MEKLSFALSSHPDIFVPDEKESEKKRVLGCTRGTIGPQRDCKGWKLLLAKERLYDIYLDAAESRQHKKSQKDLNDLKYTSNIIVQLSGLDYETKQKEASLRSWAKYKISLAKTLHNYNILYSKFHRDLQMNVNKMNKASNLEYSSPNQLISSMRLTMMSMKSFISMLQPMARVMQRMNEINLNIIKLGHEVGPEGANRVFADLREKISAYPDISTGYNQIGRTDGRPTDELMVGKFYQDWTRDCLSEGIDMLRYCTGTVEKHGQKLQNLAALGKFASQYKAGRKASLERREARTGKAVGFESRDYKNFSLPTSFALGDIGGKNIGSVSYHKTAGSAGGVSFSTSSHLTGSGGPGVLRGESAVTSTGSPTTGHGGVVGGSVAVNVASASKGASLAVGGTGISTEPVDAGARYAHSGGHQETVGRRDVGDRYEKRGGGHEKGIDHENVHGSSCNEFIGSEIQIDTKILQEIEDDLTNFPGMRRLEMDIKDIMNNEVLNDPYLLQAESITQMALGKDIAGLDGSFSFAAQIQGSIFR